MTTIGQERKIHRQYKFIVEVDDIGYAGFQSCSDISGNAEEVREQEGGDPVGLFVPGGITFDDITLVRGAAGVELWEWWKEVYNYIKQGGLPDEQIIRNLEIVQFDTNKATIKPVSGPLLDEIAEVMQAHPEILQVEVQGHTDNRGGWQLNLRLSKQRAEAVLEALVTRGIETGRLTAKGFGPREPIATNATDEGREQNRRVEFKITERKKE